MCMNASYAASPPLSDSLGIQLSAVRAQSSCLVAQFAVVKQGRIDKRRTDGLRGSKDD